MGTLTSCTAPLLQGSILCFRSEQSWSYVETHLPASRCFETSKLADHFKGRSSQNVLQCSKSLDRDAFRYGISSIRLQSWSDGIDSTFPEYSSALLISIPLLPSTVSERHRYAAVWHSSLITQGRAFPHQPLNFAVDSFLGQNLPITIFCKIFPICCWRLSKTQTICQKPRKYLNIFKARRISYCLPAFVQKLSTFSAPHSVCLQNFQSLLLCFTQLLRLICGSLYLCVTLLN